MFPVEFSFNNIFFQVIGMAFHTASSNIYNASIKRAVKLLEDELAKKLFYPACRHHIYELQIGAVWQELFDEVEGPGNIWFKSAVSVFFGCHRYFLHLNHENIPIIYVHR